MSAIGGKKREEKNFDSFAKYVGFFKGEVAAINPDRAQLNKLLGRESKEEDKEIDYTGEKDGVRYAKITFWLAVEGHEGVYIPHTIKVTEDIKRNKAEDKIQLVNQVGESTYVEADEDNEYNEESLFESFKNFTKVNEWVLKNGELSDKWDVGAKPAPGGVEILAPKNYRPALVGEGDLYEFIKVWLNKLDYKDESTKILLDSRKLFGGNFKDIQAMIGCEFEVPFVALAFVRVDEDDTDKQYQQIYKKFLPANFMKFINNGNRMPNKFSQNKWADFMKECEGEYGPNGFYVLEPLKEYNPDDDFATRETTKADVTPTNNKY
jgi:hypothetical protein